MAIYILKDFKNIGIGKALMKACYKELSNFKTISLWVLESNKEAIGFYEHEGFNIDGHSKFIYSNKTVRMTKNVI